jgi:adenylylsulfate kinase
VAKLFTDACAITITAFISPYISDRALVRELHEKSSLGFIEVFVDAPLEVVEERDPKGLYKKARTGEIKGTHVKSVTLCVYRHPTVLRFQEFTGVSAPYEAPPSPEIHLKTSELNVTQSVAVIVEYLISKGFI